MASDPNEPRSGPRGSLRIPAPFGIPVYVHWSWAVVGVLEMQWRGDVYGSPIWNMLEYIGLFALVLVHEFGHALACRSVGGSVGHILLWPLGGVAQVRPPQRPGALLWSIVAGPLTNLIFGPICIGAMIAVAVVAPDTFPNLEQALLTLGALNVILFVFNMLPIYPLDGGQIVRALLWFVVGRERSLVWTSGTGMVASVIGGIAGWVFLHSFWIPLIGAYAFWRSRVAFRSANAMAALLAAPQHETARCPGCGQAPPLGPYWRCPAGHRMDAFEDEGACDVCDLSVQESICIACLEKHPVSEFVQRTEEVVASAGSDVPSADRQDQ